MGGTPGFTSGNRRGFRQPEGTAINTVNLTQSSVMKSQFGTAFDLVRVVRDGSAT